MGRKLKVANLWLRRKLNVPLLLVVGVILTLLFLNDDSSYSLNREYDREITNLKAQIKENKDSAMYYDQKYQSLKTGGEELERAAREQYSMQRPTEDVYHIK